MERNLPDGWMAQQAARVTVNHKVSGSNPLPTVAIF